MRESLTLYSSSEKSWKLMREITSVACPPSAELKWSSLPWKSMVSTAKISLDLVKVYVVMVALSLPMRSVMVTRLLASQRYQVRIPVEEIFL